MKPYDQHLDEVPEDIIFAANKVARYAKEMGWDKDWAIGPVMARYNGLHWVETRHFHDMSYEFDVMAEKVAASRGQVVVYPGPCEIQLDIDSVDQLSDCKERILRMIQMDVFPANANVVVTNSKTEGHYHLTMTVSDKPLTEWQRIALQAVLGSDPMREYLNCMRAMTGVENVTRLFETPETVQMLSPNGPVALPVSENQTPPDLVF